MNKTRLIALLDQMLRADLTEVRSIIEATFTELQDPSFDDFLHAVLQETPDERLHDAIHWHGRLIRACLDSGIDNGFALIQAEQRAGLLDAIAMEMTKPPSWSKLRATLEAYGHDLLTDDFDRALGAMITHLQEHRRFLAECRRLGSDAAFRRHGVGGPHIQINLATLLAPVATLLEQLNGAVDEDSRSPRDQTGLLRLILGEIEPSEHAELWGVLQDRLGNQLTQQAKLQPSKHILLEAVEALDRALKVRSEHAAPNAFASTQNNRGIAIQALATISARLDLFDRALEAFQAAARIWTLDDYPHDRAILLNNLGDCLRAIGDLTRRTGSYRQALATLREALDACDPVLFPDDHLMIQRNLGAVHLRLAENVADPQDLAVAIDLLSSAISAMAATPWAPILQTARKDLANAKRLFGERNGDVASLKEAIEILRGVVEAYSKPGYEMLRADAQADLAAALLKQGELEAGNNALVDAIAIARVAVDVQVKGPDPHAALATRNTLGIALRTLGMREMSADLLRNSASVFEDIRAGTSPETSSALWTSAAINFTATLQSLGEVERDPACYRKAIEVAATGMLPTLRTDQPLAWATLANATGDAWLGIVMLTSDPAYLKNAISAYHLALEERTEARSPTARAVTQNNLGNALRIRGELRGDKNSSEAAVEAFRAALCYWQVDTATLEWARTSKNLALALADVGRFDEVAVILSELIDNLLPAIWSARDLEEEHRFLREVAGVGDELAYALVRLGRPFEAVDAIDRGRAIAHRSSMDLAENSEIQIARHHWRACCEAVRRAVGAAVMSPEVETEQLSNQRAEVARLQAMSGEAHAALVALLTARAQRPGQRSTLVSDDTAPDHGALAILVAAHAGGAALVLQRDSSGGALIKTQHLDELTSRAVDELLSGPPAGGPGWLRHYADFYRAADVSGTASALRGWGNSIDGTLERLWAIAMGSLDRLLRDSELPLGSEVVLSPPGRLSILPLHAARRQVGGQWRYFVEDWPTALAAGPHSAAESRKRATKRRHLTPNLLAVTDPLQDLNVVDNPAWSQFEGYARARLDGPAATVAAVCASTAGRTILSFYCHGDWDPDDPENSALVMAGSDRLTVRELRRLDLSACQMAILAACETGVAGVHELPDEFIGLPAALSEAGVPGVLSTLWPVEAGASFHLVAQFLATIHGGETPARALREAQLSMLNGQAYSIDHPTLQGVGAPGAAGGSGLTTGDPAVWAAFIYTGA